MATRIRFSIFAIAREHSVSHFWGLVKDAISYSPVSFLPSAEEGRDSRSSKSAISFFPACASCGVGSVQNFRLCRRMLLIPRVVEARQKCLAPVPPRSREWACHGKKKHFLRCIEAGLFPRRKARQRNTQEELLYKITLLLGLWIQSYNQELFSLTC